MPIKECEGNHSVIWDSVAACFTQKGTQIPNYLPGKENYDIVWPFLFQVLQSQLSKEQNVSKKICDFGCGTGIFAEKMHQIFVLVHGFFNNADIPAAPTLAFNYISTLRRKS